MKLDFKEIVKLGISLFIFCAVAAMALAFTNELTKGVISDLNAENDRKAKKAVLSEAEEFKDIEQTELDKLKAQTSGEINGGIIDSVAQGLDKNGEVVGYVVKSLPLGFGGPMVVTTGIKVDGTISGVRIGKNAESPGLGSKAQEPKFYEQYNGLSIGTVKVNKVSPGENEIQAITASTITSKAVTRGVNVGSLVLESMK